MSAVSATPVTPARRRPTTWVALVLLLAALGMVGFMAWNRFMPGGEENGPGPAPDELIALAITVSVYVSVIGVGALLSIRRPDNAVGWLLLVGGLCFSYADFSIDYVERSIALDAALPGYQLVDYLLTPVSSLGSALLFIWVPLLFPNGRLPGRRWRAMAWAAAATTVSYIAAGTATYEVTEYGPFLPNPLILNDPLTKAVSLLKDVSFMLTGVFMVVALGSVVLRFRRAGGVERQQLKWFLAAAAVLALAVVAIALTLAPWAWMFLVISIGLVPIAIGIAVLRYRLYDIDRLISRTIGWAIVTILLVGAFAALVLGSSAVLHPLTGGNTLAVAGSTLVVAALFMPLRGRVQRAVDRRFDRARYSGEQLVSEFGERLRDQVDLQTIRAEIPATIDVAVRPAHVGVWLRSSGDNTRLRVAAKSMREGAA